LVLYKNDPASVKRLGKKVLIELTDGRSLHVRPKDVMLLHPGPVSNLGRLKLLSAEPETAWELLAGHETTLQELSELIYGGFTPETAWSTWNIVVDGLYFTGRADCLTARTPEEVDATRAQRDTARAERAAWDSFLQRIQAGEFEPQDAKYLTEVEELAMGRVSRSRCLRALGRTESPENAHALLLEISYFDNFVNPYPHRLKVASGQPSLVVAEPPHEPRVDLTYLPAYAIDDEGAETPDDALSLEGNRLWVHVADVAASVLAGSDLELEARARGSTLYLPETIIHMLPESAVALFGLGMSDTSPAFSFGLDINEDGSIAGVEVVPSLVRVSRITYQQAEARLNESPFKELLGVAERYQQRRRTEGAIMIDLPEVKVLVKDREVVLHQVPPLRSRGLVSEAMIMAGEAVAIYALERRIPLPFATQAAPGAYTEPKELSEMYACRRMLRPKQYRSSPARHTGLGLEAYVQATSPLRRYLDLVVHQQLRAFYQGEKLLDGHEMLARVGAAEAVAHTMRRAEQLSTRHWILVYLATHDDWHGEGVLVGKHGQQGTVLIPDLGLDPRVHLPKDMDLDSTVQLALTGVNIPLLEAHFRVL
jgi:exoribonuclease-2